MKEKALVFFSGGKDCIYSLEKLSSMYSIVLLVTSINIQGDVTYTDGLELEGNILNDIAMLYKKELNSGGHPTTLLTIETDPDNPARDLYERSLQIAQEHSITKIITGDLNHLHGIDREFERYGSTTHGLEVVSPAGDFFKKHGARAYIQELIDSGIRCIISGVRQGDLTSNYVGREITKDLINEIGVLFPDLDITGEDGEFQTLVVGSSFIHESLHISHFKISDFKTGRDSKNHFYSRMVDIKYTCSS